MRRAFVSIAMACAASGSAVAQPGQTAPPAQPPPQPPPGWGAPPPYYAAPGYHLLTDEERSLLARGEISDGAHVGGGLVGTFFGFGLGHLVQGRFTEKGWIFMAGEAVTSTLLITVLVQCYGDLLQEDADNTCDQYAGFLAIGLVGAVGFRIWELVDVWGGPTAHNERVRAIRVKAGLPPYGLFLSPSLGRGDGGGVAGLTLRF